MREVGPTEVLEAGARASETVVVGAAGGGVGTLLVQRARQAGARVVALAGQPGKLALARDLGADVAVDYRQHDWPDSVREAAGQVDVVFDGVGGEGGRAAFGLLRTGGRFYPFGMASGSFAPVTPELATQHRVTLLRGGPANAEEAPALTRKALAEAAAGRLPPGGRPAFGLPQPS